MEYLELCRMREVENTSTKLLSVHVRDAFRISTWSLVMLRSWTNHSFWTNLLGERIVLVHITHWLIFLVHWNPSLHSSTALFALRTVSSCQRLNNPLSNSLRVWDATENVICWMFWTNTPFTNRFAFECDWTIERSRSRTSWMNWYMSFGNEMTKLVYLIREWK